MPTKTAQCVWHVYEYLCLLKMAQCVWHVYEKMGLLTWLSVCGMYWWAGDTLPAVLRARTAVVARIGGGPHLGRMEPFPTKATSPIPGRELRRASESSTA